MKRFTADPVLAQLKDFQRTTVEHVFGRMYEDKAPAHRFLVADEVGLGKTLVARGLVAKVVEQLQDRVERVDVVYVCSNTQIAVQNVRRLRVTEYEAFDVADRITMLPATAHHLAKNKINIVSFTPGTSFDLSGGSGHARERAMLRSMLMHVWPDRFSTTGSMRVFQGGVSTLERFRKTFADLQHECRRTLELSMIEGFRQVIDAADAASVARGEPTLPERFDELTSVFSHARTVSGWKRRELYTRSRFIGELRDHLARACLDALQPDLIILDEFQRFKHLLAAPGSEHFGPAAELAHELFGYVDEGPTKDRARVLLLSATPYKMLTSGDDADDNHYEDLVATTEFLLEHDEAAVSSLRQGLRDMRRGLLQVGRDGGAAARSARDSVESVLRRVMVRTERLAETPDRQGMLTERSCRAVRLEPEDVERYVGFARIAKAVGAGDPLEYWKSAPFLLNFMDDYELRRKLDAAIEARSFDATLVDNVAMLPWDRVIKYLKLEPANARLRWMIDDIIDRGAWKLLWMPPALPYLEPAGPYADVDLQRMTKRLVFSSWTMVPKAIATLLTYEAERHMVTSGGPAPFRNTPDDRQSRGRLLDFSKSANRLTGMPVVALLYPSPGLAEVGDPLELCRAADASAVPAQGAVARVAELIAERLLALKRRLSTLGIEEVNEGRIDDRWYWMAPIWLDWLRNEDGTVEFFADRRSLVDAFTGSDRLGTADRFRDHLNMAQRCALEDFEQLGRPPDDLVHVLAQIALAGPGVVALRALTRVTGRSLDDPSVQRAACRVAWGARSLFNAPEVTELVRGVLPSEGAYWQQVLDYCTAGNLQSVLDEYAHMLLESRGHLDPLADSVPQDLARAMHDTFTVRTVNYGVASIESRPDARVEIDRTTRMRAAFALRLSEERSEDGMSMRPAEVRDAFNSPFWPFVLATTSAGQEGLDFHTFCHAVVHWNVPSNPVDFEQREGRVHRYKGHAVRRNVADQFGHVGRSTTGDPWEAMFAAAAEASRTGGHSEIVPFWVFPREGGAAIERYIPAMSLSRDAARAAELKRSVAAYRIAIGASRQDELLAYLAEQCSETELAALSDDLRIDLSPAGRKD